MMLKREIKKLDPTGLLSRLSRKRLETAMQTALQRLMKDDITAEQLSNLSDDDDDDSDEDGGNDGDGEPLATGCCDLNPSDMSEEELYMFDLLDI